MSEAPLFQNTDDQEAAYGSDESAAQVDAVAVPAAALGGGTGSPHAGAGTPGTLPPAIAPLPDIDDDTNRPRDPDVADATG